MMNRLSANNKYLHLLFALFFSVQCSHNQIDSSVNIQNLNREPNVAIPAELIFAKPKKTTADWMTEFPTDGHEYIQQITHKIKSNKKNKLSTTDLTNFSARIAKYVGFIMYKYPNPDLKKAVADRLITRLFSSSVQFILCKNIEDFACLEKTPVIAPTSAHRIENPKLKLGEVVKINDELEKNMDYYFNDQIFSTEDQYKPENGIAKILENKIKSIGTDPENDGISMAIYGMDDISKANNETGSLQGIYSALIDRIDSGTPVNAVFDQIGANALAKKPVLFSYIKPKNLTEKNWILSPLNIDSNESALAPKASLKINAQQLTNLNFQYNGGTQGLLQKLSENITDENESKGRIEWPNNGIMHNKFFIFKENNNLSVWTGTANITRTCLGTERNSNLSVLIHNNEVGKSYLTEFNEMFQFQDEQSVKPDNHPEFVGKNLSTYFPRGRFHTAKRPNTKRYFKFINDQTDLRLYFSPTDDAEHRALLPMLLSARRGDQIIISMFGAAGIEYARAIQWAAARGVDVKIIVDSPTACGNGSWAGLAGDGTLLEKNPYRDLFNNMAQIEIRKNDKNTGEVWKQNHQKIGLLLRKKSDGHMNAEYFTFGSQNWSQSGNDTNDENLIILKRESAPLKIGVDFQNHFLNFLWPKSLDIPDTGCSDNSSDTPPGD